MKGAMLFRFRGHISKIIGGFTFVYFTLMALVIKINQWGRNTKTELLYRAWMDKEDEDVKPTPEDMTQCDLDILWKYAVPRSKAKELKC